MQGYRMELFLVAGAGLVFVSILLSPLPTRTGAPLLLFFLVIGMLVGEDGPGGYDFNDFELAYDLGSVALAIILFSGGLDTRITDIRKAWVPALLLATVGVAVTSGIVGLGIYLVFGVSLFGALLFGAVVGSTDAAATFMLLQHRDINLKGRNKETILLESGINDPSAIFLTILFLSIVDNGVDSIGWSTLTIFFAQLGLGTVSGFLGGLVLAFLVNRVPIQAGLFSVLVLSGGLLLFGATQWLGGSGFLAIYICGVIVSARIKRSEQRISNFHEGLSWMSQVLLFLMLGLLVTPHDLTAEAPAGILIAGILMFIARPLAVMLCLAPLGFSLREQIFVGWVGLRGAVPIFLAIIPVISPGPIAVDFFNEVFIVVIASLLLQGWTIPAAAKLLKVESGRRNGRRDR